jgi:hypothetical protein
LHTSCKKPIVWGPLSTPASCSTQSEGRGGQAHQHR